MTKYGEAKKYFEELSRNHIQLIAEGGVDILNTYYDIKKQSGEFIAAKFILDIYIEFTKEITAKIKVNEKDF